MRKLFSRIIFLFLLVAVLYSSLAAQEYRLTVVIEGIREVQGKIQVGLFNAKDGFLKTGMEFKVAAVPVDSTSSLVVFDSVPPGKYGVSLYHDLDSGNEINKNILGIPVEPYGISNDAWHRFSAPKWDEAAFVVGADTAIVINLRH